MLKIAKVPLKVKRCSQDLLTKSGILRMKFFHSLAGDYLSGKVGNGPDVDLSSLDDKERAELIEAVLEFSVEGLFSDRETCPHLRRAKEQLESCRDSLEKAYFPKN